MKLNLDVSTLQLYALQTAIKLQCEQLKAALPDAADDQHEWQLADDLRLLRQVQQQIEDHVDAHAAKYGVGL